MRIRPATLDDAEALHALYHAAYAAHEDPHRPPVAALRDTVEDVRGYIRGSTVLVAEDEDGRLVGSVALRRVANVRRLAVAPDAKRAGLGATLLEAAVARAEAEGFEYAALDTMPEHPWLPEFYRRHGFEDRSVEHMADGTRWLAMRRRLKR